jgi:hypothetical protein
MLKECAISITDLIATIFNILLRGKTDCTVACNYRPIFLLSLVRKAQSNYEVLMDHFLNEHILSNKRREFQTVA